MSPFELTILGSSSATPTATRNPSAQVLNVCNRFFLIDCGEGAQMQMRKYKVKMQKIDAIFISHLHGDHYLGLPGLLGTLHLLGRTKELHIYSPKGLQEMIKIQHHHSDTYLNFSLIFHELNTEAAEKIYEDDAVVVETIPLNHRVPCAGFLFTEKQKERNVIKEKLTEYKIPFSEIPNIKAGNDYRVNFDSNETGEKTILNSELTANPFPPRKYAYCSDTKYDESIIEKIKGVDLLYHEATFDKQKEERAKETYHCTAEQAARIAKKAQVKQLIIGHYSARYHDLNILLNEAKEVFENTVLAIEGETYGIVEKLVII